MPQLVGRESELAEFRAAYTNAATACAPQVLTITGPAGIGKSALTQALEEFSAQSLVLRAVAYPLDRLIPFSVSTRLPNLFERVEQATRERPAVIVIDDAHYADEESLAEVAAMMHTLSDRPLLVVLARDDEDDHMRPIAADATILLRELDSRACYDLARMHYPQARPNVLDVIVANAHGVPYEVISIAGAAARRQEQEPGAVDRSARAAIAKELAALPAPDRMALQMLALFPEPLESALIELAPPDFPIDHCLTASAITETIAMKIPLRRRIIDVMERRGIRDVRDRLALAEQSLAVGDRPFAQRVLLDLAFAARDERLVRVVMWAGEHHLEIGEPPEEHFIEFYAAFFTALMQTHAYARAEAVAAHALSEAQHRELPHLGLLAAQLVQAQWSVERHEAAKASYERYARAFEDPDDLQVLRNAAPWLTVR